MTEAGRRPGVALAALALLAACTSAGDPPAEGPAEGPVTGPVEAAPPAYGRYVALGDSFTAAPLVPNTDLAEGCLRSDRNYPSLVAEALGVGELVDVSCSGARTRDLFRRQPTVEDTSVPPQLRPVRPDTDLVTLGIGGNDFDLFETLVGVCGRLGRRRPPGSPCADELGSRGRDLVAVAARIGDRVRSALEETRRRAPDATVVLVGYPRLVPDSGACADLPFAPSDYAYGRRVSAALDDALQAAARRAGVTFVDVHALSEGHDICSDEPWVNGARTVRGEALAFHPLAEGMQATADAVVDALGG